MIKSSILLGSLLSPFLMASPALAADAPPLTIVQDGKPRAEIVVTPENRPRMTSLAALELQHFLEKMSGARLPIVTEPTTTAPIKIFGGESP